MLREQVNVLRIEFFGLVNIQWIISLRLGALRRRLQKELTPSAPEIEGSHALH